MHSYIWLDMIVIILLIAFYLLTVVKMMQWKWLFILEHLELWLPGYIMLLCFLLMLMLMLHVLFIINTEALSLSSWLYFWMIPWVLSCICCLFDVCNLMMWVSTGRVLVTVELWLNIELCIAICGCIYSCYLMNLGIRNMWNAGPHWELLM